ncbi:MAG: efflux transporter outer membrane subunit [Rhodopseudomonas palustris]|jgi:NodT family efflux transporter outer membrane factor (OMF) lipoprotein|nr:MAG: efflux transporter outer membrane subunit [Rhodopseudomonas palustris]
MSATSSRSGRLVRTAAALSLALSAGGCLLTNDLPDPALDVPSAYKAGRPGGPDAGPSLDWWRGFRSAELTSLMQEAQSVNLDIAAATARMRQADAQARITGSSLLPLINGEADVIRRKNGSATSVSTYTTSLSASYEIDFWGKNREATISAEEGANAARFDRDVVALTTLASVANAYFQVLAAQDRIRTAKRNIASAERILDAIKQRQNVGTSSALDVAQQESVLANQRASLPPLRLTLAQNINTLATLVGRPPESVTIAGGSLDQIAAPRVKPGLPSQLLTQRPDIRRQEARLAAATANVGSARAQLFPSIQLTGQGGYQSVALAALFTPQAAFTTAAASLTQPIFDGGRLLSNLDLTKAQQDELLQTYRKTVVSAFADVDNALESIRQNTERLRLQRKVVETSRRAFDLAEQQLRAGTADIVTVLNTQQTLFAAEDTLSQAQLSRLLAIVSLHQALGGGWRPGTEGTVDAL